MRAHSKNILQVVGAMNMGGAETFLMNVLREMNKEDYNFVFLCYLDGHYDYEDEITELGAKIVRIPDTRISNPLRFLKNIQKVINDEKIDAVHSHVDLTTGYVMLASKLTGTRIRIAHSHNTSVQSPGGYFKRISFSLLGHIMNACATKRIACGIDAGKFMFGDRPYEVINNGIDTNKFMFNKRKRIKIRNEFRVKTNDTLFLHIGRFEQAKNHKRLISIFHKYHELNQSSKLILIGDGSLFDQIKDQIDKLGLNHAIFMAKKRKDVQDFYSASDVFIMPSLYEGLPVTLIEAQINGLPCIVSDRIDKTVKYGEVIFCSLEMPDEEWAQYLQSSSHNRQVISNRLTNDYDIGNIVKKIRKLYET